MSGTLTNQSLGRIVVHETFDGSGFTTNQSLAQMRLTKSESLNPVITHLMGNEKANFPLTFLTEGQKGGYRGIAIEDVEYNWPVMGRLKKSDSIVSHEYADNSEVGKFGVIFEVVFKTNWLKQQHTVISPNGKQARIVDKPTKVGSGYRYRLQLIYREQSEFCSTSELIAGTRWSMTGGANVAEAYSSGNESNKQAPGKIKNQISFLRKSYEIGGNVSNKTVEFQFNIKGSTTNYWMPWEEYQHELQFKEACEEHLWWSTYNRNAQGEITTIDQETGFPIPIGAGVVDQIPNKDTYGFLTTEKLKNTIGDVLYGATDTDNMNVILYTGKGGAREFDEAIKREGNGAGWSMLQGDAATKFVTGAPGTNRLEFGAYFTVYRHVDGHTITLKPLPLLDHGSRAENAPKHPISNYPLTSYEMYFIDMGTYDGERNVQMVSQKGRTMIRGIEQGMALIKGNSYGDYTGNAKMLQLATDQDKTSIHYLKSLGVAIRRNTHCLMLTCDLS